MTNFEAHVWKVGRNEEISSNCGENSPSGLQHYLLGIVLIDRSTGRRNCFLLEHNSDKSYDLASWPVAG